MDIRLFDYDLPRSLIAQKPLGKRNKSRLLVLNRSDAAIRHDLFYNLENYLKKGDVLVINKSRVTKCRLSGRKENTGASIECMVLGKSGISGNDYEVLLKPSKRLKEGDRVFIGDSFFRVLKKYDMGKALVRFDREVGMIFKTEGRVPLPPYIKNDNIDADRYQTIYADIDGSTAAPTAGLHFTQGMMELLKEMGVIFAELYLDIGPGTFRPVLSDRIEDHVMHREKYSLSGLQAGIIEKARTEKRRVIAVGTTSARTLETIMQKYGRIRESAGHTGIYIYPPYRFQVVDAMITNFHLPRSTLLIMVSAFAGRESILRAYGEAIEKKYRFYSFGDCMFII